MCADGQRSSQPAAANATFFFSKTMQQPLVNVEGIIATCGYNWGGGGGMGLSLLAVNTRNHTGSARRTTYPLAASLAEKILFFFFSLALSKVLRTALFLG